MDPMADRMCRSPALAQSEADATSNNREAEPQDDRVRLGPSAAVDHEADALPVACILPVDLQQLGVGALESVLIGR